MSIENISKMIDEKIGMKVETTENTVNTKPMVKDDISSKDHLTLWYCEYRDALIETCASLQKKLNEFLDMLNEKDFLKHYPEFKEHVASLYQWVDLRGSKIVSMVHYDYQLIGEVNIESDKIYIYVRVEKCGPLGVEESTFNIPLNVGSGLTEYEEELLEESNDGSFSNSLRILGMLKWLTMIQQSELNNALEVFDERIETIVKEFLNN